MVAQSDFDQIAGRLRGMSRDGSSIEAAQVKLIGLDEIREAAGPRWPRMRERVRTGSLEILSKHTGPDDVVIPAGDGFLIVLAESRPGQTQRRCQEMRDALLSFYLGEEALKSLRAEVKNRSLTADGLTDLIASTMRGKDSDPPPQPRIIAKSHGREVAHVRVFVAHERKIGASIVAPIVHERGGRRLAYNSDFILDGRHHTPQDFLELDIALLDEALNMAMAFKQAEKACAVGLHLHATTMQQRRSRETYLSWLADLDPELKRYLFVTIAEIEKGTPLISIAEWTSSLRAHLSRIWLDFHYTDHAISSVSGAGAWAAGFHLPIHTGAQKGPRAERTMDQLKFWSKTLRGQGMRLVVNGFQEPDFLSQSAAVGVDFATSDTLWPFEFGAHDLHAPASLPEASSPSSAPNKQDAHATA